MILEQGKVPHQWCNSHIILLYKKGDPLDLGNYRPISLLPSIYKLFSSILLKRITNNIDIKQPVEQAGFRSGFSTTDHIHTLEQILEKFKEYNQRLYIGFIDYFKAFDSIYHSSIWEALKSCDINCKYTEIIKNIYSNASSRISLENKGEEIPIQRGVRQGDPLSPKLFIAVLENIFQTMNWKNKGIWIEDKFLSHLRFADDIVVFAKSASELKEMITALSETSRKVGLQMNFSKTKIMTNYHQVPIKVDDNIIEYVDNYVYLGKQISFNQENNNGEVERRVNTAWKKYWMNKEILKGKYSMNLKKTVIETCILPSLTYACQTWTYNNNIKNKITTTQRAMERSMLKLRRIDKVNSNTIREKTSLTDALTHAQSLKWRWAGHVCRDNNKKWTFKTTKWKGPLGKRKVGRPTKRWADDITEVAGRDWMNLAQDREKWKSMEEAFTRRDPLIEKGKKRERINMN
ncbi:hypothetical protein O0L34_g12828 [Tuta absoluta]|nr:hypothetical protein O0L34_g12828 [Tuta absoluta]